MDRFNEEGPSGLYDRDREGRPPKIDEEVEQEIERLLEQNPTGETLTERGENATRQATDRIAEHLDRELGVDAHPETVREALNRLDYSWTRPRRKLPSTGPEAYRERLEAIVQAVSRAGLDTSVLARDETTIKRFPPLRRQWQPVGEQRPVMVPESNEDFTLHRILLVWQLGPDLRDYPRAGLRERTIRLHNPAPRISPQKDHRPSASDLGSGQVTHLQKGATMARQSRSDRDPSAAGLVSGDQPDGGPLARTLWTSGGVPGAEPGHAAEEREAIPGEPLWQAGSSHGRPVFELTYFYCSTQLSDANLQVTRTPRFYDEPERTENWYTVSDV